MTDHLLDRVGSRLRIERFRAQYLVAADHPAPERVKSRLDGSITDWLPHALGVALAGALPATAPDVWMIRRLHVDLDVNVAWDRDDLLRVLAEHVGDLLLRTIRGGADGRDVVWFPDRAAYLAGFLSDRADGRGNTWYYAPFEGLGLLPVSAALRTAICEVPETGLAAMRRLAADAVRRVLAALTVQDARTILDVFAAAAPSGDPSRCIEAAWTARQALLATPADVDESRDVLRLYLAALEPPDASGSPLRDAARAVVRLDRLLRDSSPEARARILSALTRTDPFALHLAAGASDAELLAPWRSGRREWLRTVVVSVAAQVLGPVERSNAAAGERRYTRSGGAFFLLPILDELPLDAATAGWPDLDGIPAVALARFYILLKCLGAPRALGAFHDGLIRELMGIAPDVSARTCFEWQASLSEADRSRFLETLENWRIARGDLRLDPQFLARVTRDGRHAAVLIDGARGIWRRIVADPTDHPTRIIRQIRSSLTRVAPGSRLFCDPGLALALRLQFPALRAIAPTEIGDDEVEIREIVTRLDQLSGDLAYLHLPIQAGLAGALDRTLSVTAQGVLRSFAWRLPGFSRSSLPYLYANFLDVPATLEDQPERRVVVLGRPPLDVIMNMTGLSRGTYRLGWLDERLFVLFPEG